MKIKKTEAWLAAEWDYSEIHALRMMPLPGFELSPDEVIERFERIVKECPKFYPAVIELALRRLAAGANGSEERRLGKGMHLMLELADPDDLDEEIDCLIDNLEKLWRFDLCKNCLALLVKRYPRKASLHDGLAHADLRMGDVDAALRHIAKAVEIAPDNVHFRSNHGWIHLIAGNLEEARASLTKALRLDPDDEVVKGNLEIHQYLTEQGGGAYFDFLLRPAEREKMDQLADDDESEELDKLRDSYNACRIEAMAQTFLQEDEQRRLRLPDLLATLGRFFAFVHQVDPSGYTLDEDISFLHEYFRPIMHKFIFKFGDIDHDMIEGIYAALLEYYGFLARWRLVSAKELNAFRKKILGMKKELITKMERYNAIRHDDDIDNEEKESIREELFDGDHGWPFL